MARKEAVAYEGQKISVRASITVWIALAGLLWIGIALLVGMASDLRSEDAAASLPGAPAMTETSR
jgi:hypothetical protein